MWTNADIAIVIVEVEGDEMIVEITTPAGALLLAGCVSQVGTTLNIDGAHVQGLHRGALGRAGLNAIGYKILEELSVKKIIIQGGVRTTGRNRQKRPRQICFPND